MKELFFLIKDISSTLLPCGILKIKLEYDAFFGVFVITLELFYNKKSHAEQIRFYESSLDDWPKPNEFILMHIKASLIKLSHRAGYKVELK